MDGAVTRVAVAARYAGPPGAANGGYGAGAIAAAIGSDVTVRLVRPVPLETELVVSVREPGAWEVRNGAELVASAAAARAPLDLVPPVRPTLDEARAASARFTSPRPSRCFVCGPERTPGDGLRI